MRVIDLENIINSMHNELQFVLRCEEVYHDKISAAAGAILGGLPKKRVVALTGPSGSGKTTTALRLKQYLENMGVPVSMLSMDNYILPHDRKPPEATDWESPYNIDRELLLCTVDRLLEGQTVQIPRFDFPTSTISGWSTMTPSKDAVVIVEGIHMLNPMLFEPLRTRAVGIYVAPRTRVVTNDEHIIRPEQIRVARRMIRDFRGRGLSLRQTVERAEVVDRGEQQHITPNKGNASIHIDTFHDYELCIIARYLRELPQFSEELDEDFLRACDMDVLIRTVRELPSLQTDYVPLDSVVREFVGGSKFDY